MKLSILMPVYNEGDLVAAAVSRVLAVDFGEGVETEIIIVDEVFQRAHLQADAFQPISALGIRPDGVALATDGRRAALAVRFDHRDRENAWRYLTGCSRNETGRQKAYRPIR